MERGEGDPRAGFSVDMGLHSVPAGSTVRARGIWWIADLEWAEIARRTRCSELFRA